MKIRRFRKYLHFVFQLFMFLAGLLGFWQQLCTLEMTVFPEEEVILLGTTGQLSEFWESCAVSLQVMVNRVFTGVMVKFRTGYILHKEKRILC